MKKQDKLFELIHEMSMSEKRYFALFSTRHTIGEKNNYAVLFEILEDMQAYDTDELIRQLEDRSISSRYLAADKNYLYNLILRSLSGYYAGKSNNLKVKELLHQAEILYEKGVYSQCLKVLDRARKIAERYELFQLLLEILHWERKVLEYSSDSRAVTRSFQQVSGIMEVINNLYEISNLHYQISDLRQSITKARSAEALEPLNRLMEHPFLQDERYALSLTAKIRFWQTHGLYYYCLDDPDKELESLQNLLSLIRENPDYLEEYPFDYLTIFSRMLTLKRDAPDSDFYPLLNEFRGFPGKVEKAQQKIGGMTLLESYRIEFARLIDRGRFTEAQGLIPRIIPVLNKYDSYVSEQQRMYFYYMFAYVLLANKAFSKALSYINQILNDFDEEIRPELYTFTRIMNLLVHFELGNFTVLKYVAESTRRYLKKTDRLYRLEDHLLKFFIKFSKKGSENRRQLVFRFLKREILEILEDSYEQKALGYFNILAWLDSHIRDISFQDAWEPYRATVRFY